MENNKLKSVFSQVEGNSYFKRNFEYIQKYDQEKDPIINLYREYNLACHSILEIGCNAGYRLNAFLESKLSKECYGVDISQDAIAYGKANFKHVNFLNSSADNLINIEDNSLDMVIVGFVFYVIDRNLLYKTVAEIDRVLKNDGFLIIYDFYAHKNIKNKYHHVKDYDLYSYKHKYEDIFTSSSHYHLLDKRTYHHAKLTPDVLSEFNDLSTISLLKKDYESPYR